MKYILKVTFSVPRAAFQVLDNHMWPVATALHSAGAGSPIGWHSAGRHQQVGTGALSKDKSKDGYGSERQKKNLKSAGAHQKCLRHSEKGGEQAQHLFRGWPRSQSSTSPWRWQKSCALKSISAYDIHIITR